MIETKRNNELNKYYDLYKSSQQKIEDEKLISESLLASIIKGLKISKVSFLADPLIDGYYNPKTRSYWKKLFFEKMTEEFFDNVEWEFVSISSMGYNTYGYSIYFKVNGIKYDLFIPNPKNITINDILNAHLGQYSLSKEVRLNVYEVIAKSYNEEDIKAAIKKENENNTK